MIEKVIEVKNLVKKFGDFVANKEVPISLIEKIKQVEGILDVKLVHIMKNPLKNALYN